MKIDLHCHTKAIKKGDGLGRNVTPELFKSKIEDADIKIVAITNHNAFDIEQYRTLSNIVSGSCLVWPGVEIDVFERGSKRWHLIVVANPKEVEEFSAKVTELFNGKDLNECTQMLDDICNSFKEIDVIYIAHYYQKKPAMPPADEEKLYQLVGEPYRIFKETSNESSMSVFANYSYNVLVGSDVKDWNQYEKCSFSELKLPVDSYEQFCLLAKRDENVVQTLLNKKDSKHLIAHPAEGVNLSVQIYADMNIIFGQKGTGKTQIVKSLCDDMKSSGLKCIRYVASEREDDFKELLGLRDAVVDLQKMGAHDCREDFRIISRWTDCNPTHFENYLNWKRTEGNNTNKSRMKITRASALVKDEIDNEDLHKNDLHVIKNIIRDLREIMLEEYLSEEDKNSLLALFRKLAEGIREQRKNDLIAEESIGLANFTINTIKSIADRSTNSVSKPSSVGLADFVANRLALFKAITNILKNMSVPEVNETEKIGSLDEKGDIFINTKFRMLCGSSKTEEFRIGIRKLREVKEKLEQLKQNIFDSDISDTLQALNEILEDEKINSIECFVGRSRQVLNAAKEIYKPSNGEKGMLLLQRALMGDADAYFLDEPELGMGNSYIDTTIRPMLIDLSRRHKYVVVATHNANIAVRTLPYMSLYRTHGNGFYSTYIGNPFIDKLVNIDDEDDVLNWADESLKALEGSREAFYERKDIYESNNT